MTAQTLQKHEIIRGNSSFDKIFKTGKKIRGKVVTVFYIPSEHSQIGIAISGKFKLAVTRNRLKRYIREIYRKNKSFFEKKKWLFLCTKPRKCPSIGIYFMIF